LATSEVNEELAMSKELRFPDPAPDQQIAAALGPYLTPPVDDAAYWNGLQRRIMARVATAAVAPTWWSVSPTMARAGLIAAGIAMLALGALAVQTRELETRMAFEAVTETELEVARIIPGIDEPFAGVPRSSSQPRR
jgi:hypothetical protein